MAHVSQVFFKISDLVNHPIRNYRRYPTVKRQCGLAYVPEGDKAQRLDYYYVPGAERYPVLVNVHGGGFVCGDKKYRSGYARMAATCGYFVVNVNYRLAPAHPFPAPTEDVLLALNYIAGTLAKQFPLDLNKVVITGDSAGGFWAAHAVAAIFSEPLANRLNLPACAITPRALLTYCAPFQLRRVWETVAPLGVPADVCNCVLGTSLKKVDASTPLPYEQEQNILNWIGPNWCECFLIAAVHDSFCGGQVDDMEAALLARGVPTTVYRANEKGDKHCTHLYPFLKGSKKQETVTREFLKRIYDEESK